MALNLGGKLWPGGDSWRRSAFHVFIGWLFQSGGLGDMEMGVSSKLWAVKGPG